MNRRALLGGGAAFVAAGLGAAGWRESVGSMADYSAYAARLRGGLTRDLRDLVRYAALAANSHNTQPWRFRLQERAIELRPDVTRRTPAVDPDDHHLFVSLGCAAANLALAAAAQGRPGEVSPAPDGGGLRYDFVDGPSRPDPLFAAIPKRQSTRAEYDGRAVPPAELARLEHAARVPGVALTLVLDRPRIGRIRELVLAANADQMADPAFLHELKSWLRFNPRSAIERGDGLFSAASGNPVLPTALGRPAFDRFFTAETENRVYARQIDSSAGLAVFMAERADPEHWMRVGQACQRFALAATSLGLKLAFINQPVEVVRWRGELAAAIGERGRPDILLRFGYGPALPFSPRRATGSIMG